jgi:hypothetical protein
MSWSLSFEFENGKPVGDAANKLSAITSPEHRDQANLAVQTVFTLIASGVVGDPDGKYNVSLSGHGNKGHVPAPGWANDCLGINVYQVGQ